MATNEFSVDPSDVYSAENIKKYSMGNLKRPTDLLGIRAGLVRDLGLTGLQQQYQTQYGRLGEFDQATDQLTAQIEGKTVGMNVIRGAQAETGRQRSLARGGIARTLQTLGTTMQARQMEVDRMYGIISGQVQERQQLILQNPKAGIDFNDSPKRIAEKLEERAKKDAQDELYQAYFGKTRGKLSRREARRKLEKAIGSDREYEKRYRELTLQKMEASLASSRRGAETGDEDVRAVNEAVTATQGMEGNQWTNAENWLREQGYRTGAGSEIDQILMQRFDPENYQKLYGVGAEADGGKKYQTMKMGGETYIVDPDDPTALLQPDFEGEDEGSLWE